MTLASILQTLQYPATHRNTLQYTATHPQHFRAFCKHCNTLQHTATHCNTPQHTAPHRNTPQRTATQSQRFGVFRPFYVRQRCQDDDIATHCNTLQHTATHCNTLQHTATYLYFARSMSNNNVYACKYVLHMHTGRHPQFYARACTCI